MPSKADYIRGLKIPRTYATIDGWKIKKQKTTEEVVDRYKRYKFTTYVEAEQVRERGYDLEGAMARQIKEEETVLSQYGNPYICKTTIQGQKSRSGAAEIVIIGDCRRVRNGQG